MAKAAKLLERMRNNPRDWTIENIETVCNHYGVTCNAPTRGSHYKISHPDLEQILTIPSKRPIKPVYVNCLIDIIDSIID